MARFTFKVFAGGLISDGELRDALKVITQEGAKFIAGQRSEKPGTASPLGRHFVRTNRKRYDWPELSPKYAEAKRRKFGTLPIMVRTGALRDAALGNVRITATARGATIELTVQDYGPFHIDGGPKLPKRDWTAPNDQDVEQTAEFMDAIAQRFFDDLAIAPLVKV